VLQRAPDNKFLGHVAPGTRPAWSRHTSQSDKFARRRPDLSLRVRRSEKNIDTKRPRFATLIFVSLLNAMLTRLAPPRCFCALSAVAAVAFSLTPALAVAATTVRWLTLSEGNWVDSAKKIIAAFEARNPDVTVAIDSYPFRQLFEAIELRMKAQDPDVDLISVDVPLVASYSARGYLAALDEYFTSEELEHTWVAASRQAGTYQGKFMAAPQNNSTQFMYVNLSLFREAGLTPPACLTAGQTATPATVATLAEKDRWTWEQVVDAAKKLTKTGPAGQVWGMEFHQVSRLYQLQALGESLGARLVADNGLKATGYLDSEAWKRAAKWYWSLFNEWKVSPKGVSPEESPSWFTDNKVAIFIGGEWHIPIFEKAGVNFGVAPHPYFAGGKPVTGTGSWHLGLNKASRNKEAAAKFLHYITADGEGTRIWFESQGQLPATQKLLTAIEQAPRYAVFPECAYLLGVYEARHTAVPRPQTPGYLQLEDIFASTFEDIRNGSDPNEALPTAARRVDRFLAQFRK
jgi:ABC-type glycerol-3-phosphate transport system substrate-binding protein